ncbi:MAG: hypothetical protein AAF845_00905 [Bacteroidota bacterium]
MSPRFAALCLLALAPLAACTWESRPDGSDPLHSAQGGGFDDGNEAVDTPLDADVPPPAGDGAETPSPTTDDGSETTEALTPGGAP